MARQFKQVTILGTGLIGSSLALALRLTKQPPRIVGFDLNGDTRGGASGLKTPAGQRAFDQVGGNLQHAVRGADLVVLATPIRAMQLLLRELAQLLPAGTVVTDTGSTKQQVMAWAEELLPSTLPFVGGHPMAGKVTAGPWDADGAIFQNSTYCVCPLPRTERDAVDAVVGLVEAIGAIVYFVDAHEHDGLVAAVSHLPYLTSVAVVNAVAGGRGWREAATLASGGFATISHLSESDPQMFLDICQTNREAVTHQLDRVLEELTALRSAIASGDEAVKARLELAQTRHREWLSGRAQEGSEERPRVDTSSVGAGSLFLPRGLSNLLRGRGKDTEKER